MTRITKTLTEQIVKKALDKAGITATRGDLEESRFKWAEAIRVEGLGGADAVDRMVKTLEKMEELRKTLPDTLDAIIYQCGTRKIIRCNLGGIRARAELREYAASPYEVTLPADHPLTVEFHELESAQTDIEKRADEIIAKVRGTVQQFTTVKKLLEAWPEAVELIPATVDTGAKLPVIRTEDLNKLVGLP